MNILDYIGRFHPVLVHLPIGILLAAICIQCLSAFKGFKKTRRAVKILLLMGFAAALFASLTGLLHAQSGEFDEDLVGSHKALGIVVTIFSLVALILHGRKKTEMKLGYFIVLFALTILILLTGHSGGSITHGVDYLRPPVAAWWDDESSEVMPLQANALIYADLVAPILKEKCTNCHGPTRQKAKLRLDQPEYIQKGGKDGDILMIGKHEEGEMWRRINLDRQDEDHMPPKEKTPLTKAEIALLTYWLGTGADFRSTLASLPKADSIIKVLKGDEEEQRNEEVLERVDPPGESILEELRNASITISFLSQDDGHISLQLINADKNKLLGLLTKLPSINTQLLEIKMPGQSLSHGEWTFLKNLTNLRRINLEGSNFSAEDLPALAPNTKLQYLNLVGTTVTAAALNQLALPELKQLYLFKTGIKSEELASLHQHFPKAEIVMGNFIVPTFVSDTTEQKERYVVPK